MCNVCARIGMSKQGGNMQFEQWSTFHKEMVGKRVREIETGDEGTVISRRKFSGGEEISGHRLFALWDCGNEMHIPINEVQFLDEGYTPKEIVNANFESITINGKRYKLVPIEEE